VKPFAIYALAVAVFAQGTSEFMLAGLVPEIAADLEVSLSDAGRADRTPGDSPSWCDRFPTRPARGRARVPERSCGHCGGRACSW
jgi:hypothetical protein